MAFEAAIFEAFKYIHYADIFYDGDLSYLDHGKRKAALDYIPVYNYMFHTEYDIHLGDGEPQEFPQAFNDNMVTERTHEHFKQYLKPAYLSEEHVVTSFIQLSPQKVLKPHHAMKGLAANIITSKVVDLGDSRNFKTAEQCIKKIQQIQACMCYVGSGTSWYDIVRIYDKPGIQIWPY